MDDVRLPDLEVIRLYSIAVRREHAPAAEVIEALRADLARLTGGKRSSAERSTPARAAPARRTTRATPKRRR